MSVEQAPGSSGQRQVGQAGAAGSQEGYWEYMQRTMQERTQNMNLLGDSVNQLGETSSKWADDASKFVNKTKKNLVMGAVKGKFGL